jgi:hypothetical protein
MLSLDRTIRSVTYVTENGVGHRVIRAIRIASHCRIIRWKNPESAVAKTYEKMGWNAIYATIGLEWPE